MPGSPTPCPCGSARSYDRCCGPYHAGPLRFGAPTPEALMRSRYCAYVLALHDYLLQTWHPSTRPAVLAVDPPGLRWLGLQIRRHALQDADHGSVEFVARSRLAGRGQRLHETSRFVRENGRWYYLDGSFQA